MIHVHNHAFFNICAFYLCHFLFLWQVVDHKLYGSRSEFDSTIDRVLEEFGVEVVCLAGFMRILTGTFVKKWNGKAGPYQATDP